MEDPSRYTFVVSRDGRWPLAWAFRVFDTHNRRCVYGEQHIESRRAAEKDAADIVARLHDGRMKFSDAGVLYADF